MPTTNVTIDDVSALIQYTPVGGNIWKDSPTSDQSLGNYFDGTYHSVQMYGASASFQFDGTAVYLYAAKRFQHGPYAILLDGQQVYNATFQSNDSIYKQLMYSATNLTPGWHNLTCVNNDPTNQTYTEIDYITWTTSMSSDLTESFGQSIGVGSMVYSSMAAWKQVTDSEPTMVTSTDGASVTINFQGNGITLEGKTGAMFGAFSAQVDNNPARQFNAQSSQTHSTLLFRQDNLSTGNHTLVVTNRGGGFTSLAIGSAVPIIWSDHPNTPPSSNSSHSHAGAIAGAVVGVVVGLAAIILGLLWFFRQRRRAQDSPGGDVVRPTNEPAFIDATPFVMPPAQRTDASSQRGSKRLGDDQGLSMYRSVPGSPGMSSRAGSFDYGGNGGPGAAGSSSAGTSVGWGAAGAVGSGWPRAGKESRHSGPTTRHEVDVDSLRDRDAGPVLLPQLPPAYSSATAGGPSLSPDPAPSSGPSPVPTSPTPVPEARTAPSPSPAPGPGPQPS